MKANEFVKKHGWQEVIKVIKSTNAEETAAFESRGLDPIFAKDGEIVGFDCKVYQIPFAEVKRLVESWELVESFGGLELAKKELQRQSILRWINPKTEALREAIADVESCQ